MKREAWNKIKWTDDEIGFLAVYNERYTVSEMAKILGKTERAIKRKCYQELNIFKGENAANLHRSNAAKKRGTDLSFEFVKKEAAKYNTRIEFLQKSPTAYQKANLMNWNNEVCEHMVSKAFSLPQLILKSYLEQIFDEKCSYNDRNILKPYEVDCYFPKHKVGWEYNGFLYHQNNKNDKIKYKIAQEKGVTLFIINEENRIKKYDVFIKNILKNQIDKINNFLGNKKIDEKYIDLLEAKIEYPNLLTKDEQKLVFGKKINEIKKIDVKLYNRIIRYKLFEKYNIKDDRRVMHYYKNLGTIYLLAVNANSV